MKNQTYSIVRVHRDRDGEWEKIVDSGLDWETARRKAVELSTAERVANPAKTSWTLDIFYIFYCQLEGTVRHRKLKSRLRCAHELERSG